MNRIEEIERLSMALGHALRILAEGTRWRVAVPRFAAEIETSCAEVASEIAARHGAAAARNLDGVAVARVTVRGVVVRVEIGPSDATLPMIEKAIGERAAL